MPRVLRSADDTRDLGARLARAALPGDVLWLHGDLGAGKTELTRGLAEGLAATSPVSSPTFALVHIYTGGRLPLYHADLYRLDARSALDLGLEEYLEGDGLVAVEWGERLPLSYFPDGLDLHLELGDEDCERRAGLSARGPAAAAWLERASLEVIPHG